MSKRAMRRSILGDYSAIAIIDNEQFPSPAISFLTWSSPQICGSQVTQQLPQADQYRRDEEFKKRCLFKPASRQCHQQSLRAVHEKWKGAEDCS
jgi:hypothetical protein